jgi:Uma2 family endonuclease
MFDYAQKILDSPDAPQQIERLYQTLEDEEQRRHDFREWITPNMKVEFINGKIVVHQPVRRRHWKTTDLLSSILSIFVSIKKLGCVGTTRVMVALTRNDYEPDLVFYSKEKADTFTDDQLLFPAPDFIVEILSKGTASKDK